MSGRSRFEGDAAQVADALSCMTGPGYVKYDEGQKAQVNKHQILAVRDIIQPLYALQQNLSFKKSTLQSALSKVASNKPEWALTKEMKKDFVETVTKRLMNILKHCSHALRRPKKPDWAHRLLHHHPRTKPASAHRQATSDAAASSIVAVPSPSNATDSEPREAEVEYFVGWNPELMAAWRCGKESPCQKTYTKNIICQECDLAPAIAIWEDGFKHPLAELTSLAWSLMASISKECTNTKKKQQKEIIFTGTSSGGAPITVKNRTDRTPLVVIYQAKKQLLQLTVHEQTKMDTYQELAIAIAKKYIEKDMTKEELFCLREKLLEEKGLARKAKKAKKVEKAESTDSKASEAEKTPETPKREVTNTMHFEPIAPPPLSLHEQFLAFV